MSRLLIVAAARGTREALSVAAAWLAGACFGVIFAINIAQIGLRQLDAGWVWVSDLSRLLFVWMVMLGAGAAYARHEHIVASFLVERLGSRWQALLALGIRVTEVLVAVVLLVSGLHVTATRMQIDYIQLGVPTGLGYLAVPALGLLMLVVALTSRPVPATTAERTELERDLSTQEAT